MGDQVRNGEPGKDAAELAITIAQTGQRAFGRKPLMLHVDVKRALTVPAGQAILLQQQVFQGLTATCHRRIAALKTMPTPALRKQWRELFGTMPPPFNRRYLESRLAYRIQELAYGGLKPQTLKRLAKLGDELDGGDRLKSRIRADIKPIVGTRLLREWQGVEHVVTVTVDGYEWQGRPYKSLSFIARAIAGTRWNGWVFFGLKNYRGRT